MRTRQAQIRCECDLRLGHCGMKGFTDLGHSFSRRVFLEKMRWAPFLFLPAPLRGAPFQSVGAGSDAARGAFVPVADFRLTPHYPGKSPLEDVLRLVAPGSDEYVTEKYAFEIGSQLKEWSQALEASAHDLSALARSLDPSVEASPLAPAKETTLRSGDGIRIVRRQFAADVVAGRERFLQEI